METEALLEKLRRVRYQPDYPLRLFLAATGGTKDRSAPDCLRNSARACSPRRQALFPNALASLIPRMTFARPAGTPLAKRRKRIPSLQRAAANAVPWSFSLLPVYCFADHAHTAMD